MPATRRTATILFTDIVGSSAVFTTLGEEDAETARAEHFAAMRNALAVHRGSEVKTLGDGFMTVFESARDAVACAVTMQQAVARRAEQYSTAPLPIRIGIACGEVTCAEDDYFGPAVIEASRLCAAAASGQILVSEIVRLLDGAAGSHQLRSAGRLKLKGLADEAEAFEVEWDAEEGGTLRVALADDSVLLRQGVASVLEAEGIEVVLQASDAEALLAGLPAARPHVAVIDVRMPPTHTTEGLDAARRIRSDHPDIGVLVLSQSIEPAAAKRLLEGATESVGYLLKERVGDIAELTSAIRTVASGGSAIDPAVVASL